MKTGALLTVFCVLFLLGGNLAAETSFLPTKAEDERLNEAFLTVLGMGGGLPASSSMVGIPAGTAGSGGFPSGGVSNVSYFGPGFSDQSAVLYNEGGPIGQQSGSYTSLAMLGIGVGGLPLAGYGQQGAGLSLPTWSGMNSSVLQGPSSQFSYDLNYLNWGNQQLSWQDPASQFRDPWALTPGSVPFASSGTPANSGPAYIGTSSAGNAPLLPDLMPSYTVPVNAVASVPSTPAPLPSSGGGPVPGSWATDEEIARAAKIFGVSFEEARTYLLTHSAP